MEIWLQGFRLVFSQRKYVLLFALLILLLVPLYAVFTDIFVLYTMSFNPTLRLPEALFIVFAAILAALGFAIAAYQAFEQHALTHLSKAGVGGGVIGIFASACAVCQPAWLVWLGLGSVTAFLVDYSIYIVIVSIAVMLYSIHSAFKSVVKGCKIPKKSSGNA